MQPYLPKLRKGHDLALPAQAGVWDDAQATRRLKRLADAIEVQPGVGDIHSIPDPWARVVLFERALFEPKHPLHPRILGEWRGMLALLGLRERRELHGLTVRPLPLDNSAGQGRFLTVVSRMKPLLKPPPEDPGVISPETTWDNLYIFGWGPSKGAFAMTSPATLVVTGASYSKVFASGEVDWFQGGILTDPKPYLSTGDRNALAEWLLWLGTQLTGDTRSSSRAKVLERLGEFARDLNPAAQAPNADAAETLLSKMDLDLKPGIFTPLGRPHKSGSGEVTHAEIVTSKPNAPVYILIDPAVAKPYKLPEKDIVIFGNESLAAAKRRGESGSSGDYGTDQWKRVVRWCTKSFFFQNELIYGKAGSFPGCRRVNIVGSQDPRQIVLPLSEKAAELFSADELEKNFSAQWMPDGGVICRLEMKVKTRLATEHFESSSGKEQMVTIEHRYEPDDLVPIGYLPRICVWPDFEFDDDKSGDNRWKQYFVFESWRGRATADDFVVRPLASNPSTSRSLTQKDDLFQIHSVERYPEVLVCRMPSGNKARLDDFTPPHGLLLLNKLLRPGFSHGQAMALGIDFGTTGTTLYRGLDRSGDKDQDVHIRRMSFKDRLVRVTTVDKNELERITRELFVPSREWPSGKVLSVFQEFENFEDIEDRTILRDGHVLFADDENPATYIQGDPSSVRSNLKWGDKREIEAALQFLTQLCIQALAELVYEGAASVDVRFSYPTAFSDKDLGGWEATWQLVKERAQLATSIPVTLNEAEIQNQEAIAATRFFSSKNSGNRKTMSAVSGAVTLDIGGGTTDIAVWNGDEAGDPTLLAHLSVLFAGRDVFLAPLRRKPEFLGSILKKVPLETLNVEKMGPSAYKAQLDAIVSAYGEAMLKELPVKQNSAAVKEFLAIQELGLCGIAFYSGLLVGRLIQTGAYIYEPGKRIPLYVGGNGSKLLRWCALGKFSATSEISRQLSRSLLAGVVMGVPSVAGSTVEIVISELPKEEVAFGLVAKRRPLQVSEDFTNPLAGERFRVMMKGSPNGNSQREWNESPDAASLRGATVRVDPGLPIFREFLKAIKVPVTDDECYDIADTVNTGISEIADQFKALTDEYAEEGQLDSVRKEPMFIMALKHLVSQRITKWVGSV